jgi:PleD family two-component response regulator
MKKTYLYATTTNGQSIKLDFIEIDNLKNIHDDGVTYIHTMGDSLIELKTDSISINTS